MNPSHELKDLYAYAADHLEREKQVQTVTDRLLGKIAAMANTPGRLRRKGHHGHKKRGKKR